MTIEDVLSGRAQWCNILGNCLDIVPALREYVNSVITDPPYGIEHKSNGQWFVAAKPIAGDGDVQLAVAIADIVQPLPLAMFFSPYQPLPIKWRSVLCWNKGAQVGIGGDRETCWKRDFELIGVRDNRPLNGKRDSAVISIPADVFKTTGHFCEKPLPLMKYLVEKLSQAGDIVLDCFAGSGTTGVACLLTGRKFIGIEIDENYHALATKRLSETDEVPPLIKAAQLFDSQEHE